MKAECVSLSILGQATGAPSVAHAEVGKEEREELLLEYGIRGLKLTALTLTELK